MSLSVLIPWSDRPELATTLARNASVFDRLDAEVLVSSCGGSRERLENLIPAAQRKRVRIVDCHASTFNKCVAVNVAALAATRDLLFILDADVVLSPSFNVPPGVVAREHFVTIEKVWEANPAPLIPSALTDVAFTITLRFGDAAPVQIETGRRFFADGARSSPGLIVLAGDDFREVGGMDSRFERWGWEDLDLIVRLQHVIGRRRVQQGEATHLTHGDELRNLGPGVTRAESERRNLNFALSKYAAGDWMGTLRSEVEAYAGAKLA